jgi:hypothetical protein
MAFQNLIAFLNQPAAAVFAEHSNVRVSKTKVEHISKPAIRIFAGHDPGFPDKVKFAMRTDPQAPKITVRQRTERDPGTFVHADVGIAFGVVVAYVQFLI